MSAAAGDETLANVKLRFSSYEHNCPLRRVGNQLVRCDNLTGAGVSAPHWVPEL
jgi:hypothetical protein